MPRTTQVIKFVARPIIPATHRELIREKVTRYAPYPPPIAPQLIMSTDYWRGAANPEEDLKFILPNLRAEARREHGPMWGEKPLVQRLLDQAIIAQRRYEKETIRGHDTPNYSYTLHWASVRLYQEAINACAQYAQTGEFIVPTETVDPLRALSGDAAPIAPARTTLPKGRLFDEEEDDVAEPAVKMVGAMLGKLYSRENDEFEYLPSTLDSGFLESDDESEYTSPEPSELTKDDISSSDVVPRIPAEPEQEIGTTCSTREVSEIVAPEDNKYLPELLEVEPATIGVPVFVPQVFSQAPSEADAPLVFNWDNLLIPDEDSDRE